MFKGLSAARNYLRPKKRPLKPLHRWFTKSQVHLGLYATIHWAIPEKNPSRSGWGHKKPLEFLDLFFIPYKFNRKQAFTPGKTAKFLETPWKFQG